MASKRILVTGGAGFIGSAVARRIIRETPHALLVFDKLTYAGNLASLAPIEADDPRYHFVRGRYLRRRAPSRDAFESFKPDWVMHLAAESHVDRSIDGPGDFIQTNLVGTLRHAAGGARTAGAASRRAEAEAFRFHHISTDEVFGSLGDEGLFREDTPYAPNSPYSASKAGSDHLVRAWHHTYGLPVVATNCSNNYGPYHFPEKLIPLIILNALEGKPLPVYGAGENVRDWLFVEDHAEALLTAVEKGRIGESYNIGGINERTQYRRRPRHLRPDRRTCPERGYRPAPRDSSPSSPTARATTCATPSTARKSTANSAGSPRETFETGLRKTVQWYLDNPRLVGRHPLGPLSRRTARRARQLSERPVDRKLATMLRSKRPRFPM